MTALAMALPSVAAADLKTPTLYVVAAGVSTYRGALGKLNDASYGVEAFVRGITTIYGGPAKVRLLEEAPAARSVGALPANVEIRLARPDRTSILIAAREAAEEAEVDDMVVVYFLGHGAVANGGRQVLEATGSDGDPAYHIELDDLKNRIVASKANRKIIILDTCRKPSIQGVDDSDTFHDDSYLKSVATSVKGEQLAVVFASSGGHESWYNDEGGAGYFTESLISTMNCVTDGYPTGNGTIQHDGVLTLDELMTAAATQVRDRTKRALSPVLGKAFVGQEPWWTYDARIGAPRDMQLARCPCMANVGEVCCSGAEPCGVGYVCKSGICTVPTSPGGEAQEESFEITHVFKGPWKVSRESGEKFAFFITGTSWDQRFKNRLIKLTEVKLDAPARIRTMGSKIGFDWGVRLGGLNWTPLTSGQWREDFALIQKRIVFSPGDILLRMVNFADAPYEDLTHFQWEADLSSGDVQGRPTFEWKGLSGATREIRTGQNGLGFQIYSWTGWWPLLQIDFNQVSVSIRGTAS